MSKYRIYLENINGDYMYANLKKRGNCVLIINLKTSSKWKHVYVKLINFSTEKALLNLESVLISKLFRKVDIKNI